MFPGRIKGRGKKEYVIRPYQRGPYGNGRCVDLNVLRFMSKDIPS